MTAVWRAQRKLVLRVFLLVPRAHRPFGDAGGLTAAVAQVVQLSAADGPAALDLDRLDHRRHHREQPFDAFAETDLADGEALLQAAAGPGDADAFEGLDPLALAFLDPHVHAHRVAGRESRDLLAAGEALGLFLLELFNHVHRHLLPGLTRPLPVVWRDGPPRDPDAAPALLAHAAPCATWPPHRGGQRAGLRGSRALRTSAVWCTADARAGRPRNSLHSSSRP